MNVQADQADRSFKMENKYVVNCHPKTMRELNSVGESPSWTDPYNHEDNLGLWLQVSAQCTVNAQADRSFKMKKNMLLTFIPKLCEN